MKKFLSVLMAATMLVGVMALTGCGGDTTEPTTDEANNQSEPASTTATVGASPVQRTLRSRILR